MNTQSQKNTRSAVSGFSPFPSANRRNRRRSSRFAKRDVAERSRIGGASPNQTIAPLAKIFEREPAQPPPLIGLRETRCSPTLRSLAYRRDGVFPRRDGARPPPPDRASLGARSRRCTRATTPWSASRRTSGCSTSCARTTWPLSIELLQDATDLTSLEALFCARALHVLLRKSVVKATRTQQSHAVLGENDWVADARRRCSRWRGASR